jgi:hypothetical protein
MTTMAESDTFPDFDIGSATFEDETPAPARTRKPRADKGVPRGPRGSGTTTSRGTSTKDRKLADDLLGPWALIVKGLAIPMPTLAGVLAERGEQTTQGIVALASPKMKEALAKASKIGPGADLLETIAMAVVAALIDVHKIDPDSFIVDATGVRKAFDATHKLDEAAMAAETPGFAPFPGG